MKGASGILLAFYSSGLLFPLALLYARIFKIDFMHDKSAALDVLVPTLASMLLFWLVAIAAFWSYPQLVPLVLAFGLSLHRLAVCAHWHLLCPCRHPGHRLLHTMELVAFDALHPASLHSLSLLSVDRSGDSHLLLASTAEGEPRIRRSNTFVKRVPSGLLRDSSRKALRLKMKTKDQKLEERTLPLLPE